MADPRYPPVSNMGSDAPPPCTQPAPVNPSEQEPASGQPKSSPQAGQHPAKAPTSSQAQQALDHPALVCTRPIEWKTVLFDVEQANRYTIMSPDGTHVASIHEDKQDLLHEIGKQLLKNQRSFRATVMSADESSQVIFRLYRPAYLMKSTMYIQDSEGAETIGEIHERFHPIKKKYDIHIGGKHFAYIKGSFLSWDFPVKDPETHEVLALIDRNFTGLVKELFTDAGKYVIHFGQPANAEVKQPSSSDGMVAARPLSIEERMAVLAAAISIDYDHFSEQSE